MMTKLNFNCEIVRVRNADKTLSRIAVRWSEGTQHNRVRMAGGAFLLACGLLSLWLQVATATGWLTLFTLGLLAWGAIQLARPSPEREMWFTVEDHIETPGDLRYQGHVGRWRYRTSSIRSIEAALPDVPDEEKFWHDVVIMMEDGNLIHMAGDLHPEHAMMVARQLTVALFEIRAAQGHNTLYAVAA